MNEAGRSTACFPGAGSFGNELRPLAEALGPAAWIVRYPGRYGPGFGIPAESFDGVVRSCVEQMAGRTAGRTVLFGHSFGAYVAFATALNLQEAGTEVAALVTAGAPAPARLRVPEQATATPSGAALYLDGVDPGALADAPSDEWRQIVVETLMSDLSLLRQFDVLSHRSVRCSILAARGDTDPVTSDATVGDWMRYTDGAFTLRTFPGGHSDFLRSAGFVSWVRQIRDGLD